MPPKKPQVFKAPDGKEFQSRPEWRDYMMLTYYSFKNKVNEPEPLVKKPGDIDGQMFDIADCDNSTLVIMDNTEQVQIDQVKNSRILIGACASSIFIRNCENCVFYTCCRQLRLREVVNCSFYIYSMAEVHIEFSNGLKFAPFNGGYPEHEKHLKTANLNPLHNLWYDIYDHNDPGKSHANWSLIPVAEYEAPWFPTGTPCEPAVKITPAGSVNREPVVADASMQSFSLQQMMQQSSGSSPAPAPVPKAAASKASAAAPPIPTAPSAVPTSAAVSIAADVVEATTTAATHAIKKVAISASIELPAEVADAVEKFAALKAGETDFSVLDERVLVVLPDGKAISRAEYCVALPLDGNMIASSSIDAAALSESKDFVAVAFAMTDGGKNSGMITRCTATVKKSASSTSGMWSIVVLQKSLAVPAS